MKTKILLVAVATALGVVLSALAWGAVANDASKLEMETSTVRVQNTTDYRVYFTVYDYYGGESAWVSPHSYRDWTAAHEGTIWTEGVGYDSQGEKVARWPASGTDSWDVKDTPKFRIWLTLEDDGTVGMVHEQKDPSYRAHSAKCNVPCAKCKSHCVLNRHTGYWHVCGNLHKFFGPSNPP